MRIRVNESNKKNIKMTEGVLFSNVNEVADAFQELYDSIKDSYYKISKTAKIALGHELVEGSFVYDLKEIIDGLQEILDFNNEVGKVETQLRRLTSYLQRKKSSKFINPEDVDSFEESYHELEQELRDIESRHPLVMELGVNNSYDL